MNQKGSIILTVVMVVMLSFMCLTILGYSLLHHSIDQSRNWKFYHQSLMEAELIRYIHKMRTHFNDGFDWENFPDSSLNNYKLFHTIRKIVLKQGDPQRLRFFITIRISAETHPYAFIAGLKVEVQNSHIATFRVEYLEEGYHE